MQAAKTELSRQSDKLNRLITRSEIEFVIEKFPENQSPGTDIFHWTRTNYPKIYMEPQRIPNCQSNSEKKRTKLEVKSSQTSNYTTKLQ